MKKIKIKIYKDKDKLAPIYHRIKTLISFNLLYTLLKRLDFFRRIESFSDAAAHHRSLSLRIDIRVIVYNQGMLSTRLGGHWDVIYTNTYMCT